MHVTNIDSSPLLKEDVRGSFGQSGIRQSRFEAGSLARASERSSVIGSEPRMSSLLIGLTSTQVDQLRESYGSNEIPEKIIPVWWMLVKQLIGPMPYMIEAATVISAILLQWACFGILLSILVINTFIGFHEEKKAKDALDSLKNSLVSTVPCKRDGQVVTVDVVDLVPGDIVFLRGGNIVPADCRWLEGDTFQVDTAALTGEALPRKVPSDQYGDELLSGCVVKQGEGFCLIQKTGVNTEIGQGMAAIQEKAGEVEMGLFERKIMAVVAGIIVLTLVDIILISLVECLDPKRERAFYKAENAGNHVILLWDLAIIVAAVPIALPLVIQVTMAIGAKTMADKKAIITHLTALQEIASMKCLCSDKTGTLTTANMTIIFDKIWTCPGTGYSKEDILTWATISSNPNNKEDPIDQAVIRSFDGHFGTNASKIQDSYKVEQFIGFNPIIKRTVARVEHEGKKMMIAKGLLNKVLNTRHGVTEAGDDGGIQWEVDRFDEVSEPVKAADVALSLVGYKTIAVALSVDGGPMIFAGIVPMLDPPRTDTALTVHRIRHAQVNVKMITGDHLNIAKETSKLIDLGTNILPSTALWPASASRDQMIYEADGFAQVLPKDKKEVVAVLQNLGMVVGMTGDGVNDAPALAQAQIGIAVDGATEAAKGAADIILTTPGLSAIFDAIVESRRIFQRLKAYILYRMAATIQIVLVLTLLIAIHDQLIKALYIILLALFNDVTMTPISSDNAKPSLKPDIPTVSYILIMSSMFGLLETIQTLIYYQYLNIWTGVKSNGTWSHDFDDEETILLDDDKYVIDDNNGGSHIQHMTVWKAKGSATYVQISIAVELLIFSCRTSGLFFMDMPSWGLILGVMGANILISFFAVYNVIVTPAIPWQWVGNIWAYCIMWLFFIDFCKIVVNYMMGNLANDVLEYVDLPTDAASALGLAPSVGSRESLGRSSATFVRPSVRTSNITRPSNMRFSGATRSRVGSAADPMGAVRASHAPRSGSLRPSIPGNVAVHGAYNPNSSMGATDAFRESIASNM